MGNVGTACTLTEVQADKASRRKMDTTKSLITKVISKPLYIYTGVFFPTRLEKMLSQSGGIKEYT